MINLNSETLISFSEAAARQPLSRTRRHCSPATVWRWAMVGIKARDGITVKLEFAKVCGRLVTSVEALQRFSDRLSADPHSAEDAACIGAGGNRRK